MLYVQTEEGSNRCTGQEGLRRCKINPSCHGELVEAGPRRADPTTSAFIEGDGSIESGAQAVAAWLIIE